MSTLERKRKYILVFLAASFSSTVVLKIAEIQYLVNFCYGSSRAMRVVHA